jgi:hypothetical protein
MANGLKLNVKWQMANGKWQSNDLSNLKQWKLNPLVFNRG